MTRIDHLQHDTICKPQLSIRRYCGGPERRTARLHTIKYVKSLDLHRDVRVSPPSLQLRVRNVDEPTLRIQPKITLAICNERIHTIARKTVPDGEGLLLSCLPPDNS